MLWELRASIVSEYRREPLRNKNMGKSGLQVFDNWLPSRIGAMDIDHIMHSFRRDHAIIIETKPVGLYPEIPFGQISTLTFLATLPKLTVLLVWETKDEKGQATRFKVEILDGYGKRKHLYEGSPQTFGEAIKAWRDGKMDFDRTTGTWKVQ